MVLRQQIIFSMKEKSLVLPLLVIFLMIPSCVRRPSSYSSTLPSHREYSADKDNYYQEAAYSRNRTKSTRASRAVHSVTHDTSLAGKVQRLANQVESKFKADNYTINDIKNWAEQLTAYMLEYSLSTQNLTDEQCESIEYNFGRIAGVVYKDGVMPVIKELEEIEDGIDDYEERSRKWEGAAERGFQSAVGDVDIVW